MEKFKQTVLQLKEFVTSIDERLKSIEGKKTSKIMVQYVCADTEFGEVPLSDYLDTFRFGASSCGKRHIGNGQTVEFYSYQCFNTGVTFPGTGSSTEIPPEQFEEHYMKGKPTTDPFHTKLWDIAVSKTVNQSDYKWIAKVPIEFTQEYSIQPHVSFYITPFNYDELGIVNIKISELTTKMVWFEIEYGRRNNICVSGDMKTPFMLHYYVRGPVKTVSTNLLD